VQVALLDAIKPRDDGNNEVRNTIQSLMLKILEQDKVQRKARIFIQQLAKDLAGALDDYATRTGEKEFKKDQICALINSTLTNQGLSAQGSYYVYKVLDGYRRGYNRFNEGNDTEDRNLYNYRLPFQEQQGKGAVDELTNNLSEVKRIGFEYLSDGQKRDLYDAVGKFQKKLKSHFDENDIPYVEDSAEAEMEHQRRQLKGKVINCPVPDLMDTAYKTSQEPLIIKILNDKNEIVSKTYRTQTGKEIMQHARMLYKVADSVEAFPPHMIADDLEYARAWHTMTQFFNPATDIKAKRDLVQWMEIVDTFAEISKHHAASSKTLKVYGVVCKNCKKRMHIIEKKRDPWRYYWRCPNYYNTGEAFNGCKNDEPMSRNVSKERITEITKYIVKYAINVWQYIPQYFAFLKQYRNYHQPYTTQHTVELEYKFVRRGV
jgi:hypothetical protein